MEVLQPSQSPEMHFPAQIQSSLRIALLLIGLFLLSFPTFAQKRNPKPQITAGEQKAGYRCAKIWKPAIFQGGHKRHGYYEGWYFKCVSEDGKSSFALIPGIALGEKGKASHAFIQYINGQTAETQWYEFPASEFSYSQKRFEVRIGENIFSDARIYVRVGEAERRLEADLQLSHTNPWPVRAFSPGIMGPFRFVPGMETCHGLVSMDHLVEGNISFGDESLQLKGGSGYIEKDWGSSFPRSYIWMQSNGFATDETSFMCSIATIPYLGKYFTGFLGFFWRNGQRYPFATYTHAKLEDLIISENSVGLRIRERKFVLEINASRQKSGELKAPQAGQMERRISESVDAEIQIRLLDRHGKLLFEGIGKNAGLEIVGDAQELIKK